MDITPALSKELHVIQSYGAGRFVVREQELREHVLVWPAGLHQMGNQPLSDININELGSLINPLPELLIIGTGKFMLPAPAHMKTYAKGQQIACEAMDTGAACRTYNVLVAEDRRVAALLMLV